MTALATLALCALLPFLTCKGLNAWFAVARAGSLEEEERALRRCRRATLWASVIGLPGSAVAGALLVDPSLGIRWPTAGAWFFASLCATTSWASIALAQHTSEERSAMPAIETIGRVVQMSTVPSLGVGLSLLAFSAVEALVPMVPAARAVLGALLSFAAVVVVSPWLGIQLGLWRRLPISIEADDVRWRVAHLPAPSPFLTHAAALPWLRTVLVTDGLFRSAPDSHWRALVHYEIGGKREARAERALRWSISVPLSLVVFIAASAVGADGAQKLVAATVLAVAFTGAASWLANRQSPSTLSPDAGGPSMQELAQTLRSLPPRHGQALPRTSHRPLGSPLYDRLFALGHDPGRRPHT
jgi:hypothetical protein